MTDVQSRLRASDDPSSILDVELLVEVEHEGEPDPRAAWEPSPRAFSFWAERVLTRYFSDLQSRQLGFHGSTASSSFDSRVLPEDREAVELRSCFVIVARRRVGGRSFPDVSDIEVPGESEA